MDDTNGRITSPNYPQNYDNNASCYWLLSSNGEGIILDLEFFETDEGNDFLQVFDMDLFSVSTYHGRLTNNTAVNVSSQHIKITFNSNGSGTNRGFTLKYDFGEYHVF